MDGKTIDSHLLDQYQKLMDIIDGEIAAIDAPLRRLQTRRQNVLQRRQELVQVTRLASDHVRIAAPYLHLGRPGRDDVGTIIDIRHDTALVRFIDAGQVAVPHEVLESAKAPRTEDEVDDFSQPVMTIDEYHELQAERKAQGIPARIPLRKTPSRARQATS